MKVHTAGYCVGGTLLASTLAWLAEKRRVRVTSATFFAAQVDFTHAGDLLVFVDEDQISALERDMEAAGVLRRQQDGDGLQHAALERSDLVHVVNNYLKGQAPSSRPAALEFRRDADAGGEPFLLPAQLLSGEPALGRLDGAGQHAARSVEVRVPVYNLATREDHIAPADSVLYGSQFFGGPVKYVLSGPAISRASSTRRRRAKYQYWTNDKIRDVTLPDWLKGAQGTGSWWPDWRGWLESIDAETVTARTVGSEAMPPIEDAPGSYVRVRA